MKNSKFNPLFESLYDRFREGSGFLAGDVVKLKSGYESMECFKSLAENVKQRVKDIAKSGNNIRIGRLHNKHSGYGALGGPIHPACHADVYEEVAPSFWRNLVTLPVECLEEVNTGINLPPVPDNQKDTRDRVTGPTEVSKDKEYKSEETDDQTKLAEKQTHVKKGDYKLATSNTVLPHSNKYNDDKPSKVKGLEKAKEVNEAYAIENIYAKMLTEDVGAMGQVNPSMSDEGDQLAGNPHIQSEDEEQMDLPYPPEPKGPEATQSEIEFSYSLPEPQEMEKMSDEQILQAFHRLGKTLDKMEPTQKNTKFATLVGDYVKNVSPELLQRIKDLSHRNKANKADSMQ